MHATNFIILDAKLENIHTEGDFFGVTTTKFFTRTWKLGGSYPIRTRVFNVSPSRAY